MLHIKSRQVYIALFYSRVVLSESFSLARFVAAICIESSGLDSQRRSMRTRGDIRAISRRKCEILNVSRNFPSRLVKLIANDRFLERSLGSETLFVSRHCRISIISTCRRLYVHASDFRNFVAKYYTGRSFATTTQLKKQRKRISSFQFPDSEFQCFESL